MKIAVAVDGVEVSQHFGHCQSYMVATVEDGKIVSREDVPNPGHEPGRLPMLMHELGVNCLLVGGIGPRAVDMLSGFGIEVVSGVSGKIDDVLSQYLAGELKGAENPCDH
jgi:predicted Fe-Mo cluster-binding NifX family protein